MATIDVLHFAEAGDELALRFSAADLPGLLSKCLDVPAGTIAMVTCDAFGERLLKEGEQQTGTFEAVLVKVRQLNLVLELTDLRDLPGNPVIAGVELVLRLPENAVGVKALAGTLLEETARLSVDQLRAYLLPSVQAGLAAFVSRRSPEQLLIEDPRADLDAELREELRAATFSAGLELLEVRHPSFQCEAFEKEREQRLAAKTQEREVARSARLHELRTRLEHNQKLKEHEVAEIAKVLEYQGVLKEISLKTEVQKRRKDEQLRRYEAISRRVGNDEIKALIFMLDDERLKAQLIEQLIERDMSEEQLRARQATDLEQTLEARLAHFAEQLQIVQGTRSKKMAAGGTRTHRLLAVVGKEVLAFDPTSNLRRDAPREIYDFKHGGLGYVRSARTAVTERGRVLLCGAQYGIYVVGEGENAATARELRLPGKPRGQGGVNAASSFDGFVYGSHSEAGVCQWDLDGIQRPQALFPEVTSRYDSTRGVTVSDRGRLFFAAGPNIYAHDLVRPDRPLVVFRGTDESITAFVKTRDEVFAGTRRGRVLRWSVEDPGSPRALHVRKANPIFMLRTAELYGDAHLLIGAKEHGLTAVSLEDGRSLDYRAPDQIRWVDGASDHLYGVTRGGYAIHVWEAGRIEEPAFTLQAPERIQDLFVDKHALATAAV